VTVETPPLHAMEVPLAVTAKGTALIKVVV